MILDGTSKFRLPLQLQPARGIQKMPGSAGKLRQIDPWSGPCGLKCRLRRFDVMGNQSPYVWAPKN